MDVGAPLIADTQAAVLMKPGQCSLDHPALAAEARAVGIAGPRDPHLDSASAQLAAGLARVVGAVAVDALWPSSRPAPSAVHRRHGIH